MKIKDLAAIAKVEASGLVSPITKIYNPTVDGEDVRGDIIFVQPDLFNSLFSEYTSDGTTTSTQGNVQRYRFLAHTCELNMKNMADGCSFWQYPCLPLNSFSIVDAFEKPAGSTAMMKPLDTDKIPATDGVEKLMVERLNNGYSLVKYRVQTGEETVAFTRGPLIPTKATTTNWIQESMA
ncbi:hypothetical protein TWF970_000146 [Orbilia oligospora]|uniref:Uncharacterized protein n=1 Tax=Orbilia oligospora TaxID=2813651 RepID=A0A7C8RMH0_ORBOL|nr:hypothetical protein TWF970_000146 [Orbilia oligospora]